MFPGFRKVPEGLTHCETEIVSFQSRPQTKTPTVSCTSTVRRGARVTTHSPSHDRTGYAPQLSSFHSFTLVLPYSFLVLTRRNIQIERISATSRRTSRDEILVSASNGERRRFGRARCHKMRGGSARLTPPLKGVYRRTQSIPAPATVLCGVSTGRTW